MGSSNQVTPLGSYRGSSPAMDRRGWNLALGFQEVFTAVVRLRYNRQAVQDADTFRAQMRQALRVADQEARAHGCSPEDVNQVIFGVVAFLDESVLGSGNPVFANWPRLPLQAELFGHQLAGEMFFQELQKALNRPDSHETADLLEVYYLCLLLGFKGRYAAGGDLRSIMAAVQEKIRRVRGPMGPLSPRGAIPADAVRPVHSDRWSKWLGRTALITAALTVVLFVVFKVLLMSGVSSLSALVSGLLK
ncbi:MAG: DotU family type IV/VI secretion system protein [Candidatus Sulfotelmatobacter sp.]